MPKTIMSLAAIALASLLLAACGSSSSSGGGSSSATTAASTAPATEGSAAVLKTASNATLGTTVLVNSSGMTLYHLGGEGAGHFICTGSCVLVWHPLTVPAGTTPTGAASLATVKRPEGGVQVTYKGEPLYTFASDTKPGDAAGQGLKDVGTWSAVTVAAGSPAPSATSSGAGSGSYGEETHSGGSAY
ncbi:MAG: hypothetical protein ACLQBB_04745 [Solirubrobacteraceae bacterium]